jgi:hypothetical protein
MPYETAALTNCRLENWFATAFVGINNLEQRNGMPLQQLSLQKEPASSG